MFSTRNYILIFIALVCSGVIGGSLSTTTDQTVQVVSVEPTGDDIPRATAQRVKERNWRPILGKRLFTIGERGGTVLFQPIQVRADKERNVYVLDAGDLKIKKFSSEGRFVRTFGSGKGQAPGEFVSPSDFTITEDHMLWVIDTDNLRITAFDSGGAVVRTMSVKG